jgi:apolipoprotein N-acyltransferase
MKYGSIVGRLSPACLAGLGFTLGYCAPNLFGLPYLLAAPLVASVITEKDSGVLGWYARLYLCYVIFHAGSNWWIASWQEQTDPYLMASGIALAVVHPLFLMLPWVVLLWAKKQLTTTQWLWVAAPILTGFEWLHGQTDASYPWLSLGYGLVNNPIGQLASMVGVYGLSFIVYSTIVGLAALFLYASARKVIAGAIIATLAVCTAVGWYIGLKPDSAGRVWTFGLIQPDVNPWDKWDDKLEQINLHLRLSDSLIRTTTPDAVVWSETAIPVPILSDKFPAKKQQLFMWANQHVPIITGFVDLTLYSPGTAPPSAQRARFDTSIAYDNFNAAMVVQSKMAPQIHRKTQLTPFAERMPFADQLAFATKWIEWGVGISAWGKGDVRVPLTVYRRQGDSIKLAPVICIESVYPEVAANFVNNGARVLCVITNDAWYDGTWGPRQHFGIARMRAIEQQMPLVRVGNSGISGAIDAQGNIIAELPAETQEIGVVRVTPATQVSAFAHLGSTPVIAVFVVSLLFCGFQRVLRKPNTNAV